MALQDWQERVVNEQNDLFEKIDKLDLFIDNKSNFEKLNEANRQLLLAQKSAMLAYGKILEVRISLFNK